MLLSSGLSMSVPVQKEYTGSISINNSIGDAVFNISSAIAYERFDHKTKQLLNYSVGEHNILDISIPGNLLGKGEAYYPLIIDPIVATNTVAAAAINFSEYTAYCNTVNNLTIPAATTLTDRQFSYALGATGLLLLI